MKKIVLLCLVGFLLSFVDVYSQETVKKEKYIMLCDKAEKSKMMLVVNGKYCFVSTPERNLISLFDGEQIKELSIITPEQKNKFETCVNRFGLEEANVKSIFQVQLKDGFDLPLSLKKMW